MTTEQARKIFSLYDEIIRTAGMEGSLVGEMDRLDSKLSAIAEAEHVDESLASDTKERIKQKVLEDTVVLMGMCISASADNMRKAVSKVTDDSDYLKKSFESFMSQHTGGNENGKV